VLGELPLDEQLVELRSVLERNSVLLHVMERTAALELPQSYVTAGCLFQTVWNVVTGRPPTYGIRDYDVLYFDDSDLSWRAEDAVIRAAAEALAGIEAEVEVRNEARVHLWYEQKFGVPAPPFASTEGAIDSFAATTCCLGARLEPDGRWRVYAPHGLSDIFNLIVRPNPVLAPRTVYESKTARWKQQWPELTILDWPAVRE
jgi:uncharacterized protein